MPSAKLKSDLEQRILIALLVFILAFTAVFVLIFGIKYNFSAKEFFTPDDMVQNESYDVEVLPDVEGKSNFLFIMNNSNTDEMYFCSVIQVDMDNIAYKVCTLDKATVSEGSSLEKIYQSGGAGNVANAVSQLLNIEIDYYIDESVDDYKEMFDAMGSVNYTVLNEIRYKDTSRYGFNIKIKEGERSLDGDVASKIIRYYLSERDYKTVSEIILTSLSQQINSECFDNREKLFVKFIDNSVTNITIRSFTEAADDMLVLSRETTGVNVYSASPVYNENEITAESINEIRGYFVK